MESSTDFLDRLEHTTGDDDSFTLEHSGIGAKTRGGPSHPSVSDAENILRVP